MKNQKPNYTELQHKNSLEHSFNIILMQFKNGRPEGVCGPAKYYGKVNNVVIWQFVRYVSTGLYIQNLVADYNVYKDNPKQDDGCILFCNPKSTQKLTVNGWTLDLSRYNREQVMEFLQKQGIKIEQTDEKV